MCFCYFKIEASRSNLVKKGRTCPGLPYGHAIKIIIFYSGTKYSNKMLFVRSRNWFGFWFLTQVPGAQHDTLSNSYYKFLNPSFLLFFWAHLHLKPHIMDKQEHDRAGDPQFQPFVLLNLLLFKLMCGIKLLLLSGTPSGGG